MFAFTSPENTFWRKCSLKEGNDHSSNPVELDRAIKLVVAVFRVILLFDYFLSFKRFTKMYIKYENLEDKFIKRLDDLFGVKDCLIEVNPGKCILPPKYKDLGERVRNMEVRSDDVWLVSYPRTGNNFV